MTGQDRQFDAHLLRAIMNGDHQEIATWIARHGIDAKHTMDTSDLLGESKLTNATLLNAALYLQKENVVVLAIEAGAAQNVATWRSNSPFQPPDQSVQHCHPLLAALRAKMPRAAKMLSQARTDLFYSGYLANSAGLVDVQPLWRLLKTDLALVEFCHEHALHELLTQTEECAAADMSARRPRFRRCAA